MLFLYLILSTNKQTIFKYPPSPKFDHSMENKQPIGIIRYNWHHFKNEIIKIHDGCEIIDGWSR